MSNIVFNALIAQPASRGIITESVLVDNWRVTAHRGFNPRSPDHAHVAAICIYNSAIGMELLGISAQDALVTHVRNARQAMINKLVPNKHSAAIRDAIIGEFGQI